MFHLVRGSAYFLVLVHRSCDHVYIYCAYLWWCMSSSPILTCVVSFLSLYTYFYVYAIYYFYLTLRCFDEFCLKCFRNTGFQSLLAINSLIAKFSRVCVRIDFIVFKSEYELSDLWLLSYVHLFVVVLSRIAKGGDC